MSFPRYASDKDSGVEWLGVVPEHWDIKRVKNAASINMGQSPNSQDCNQEGEGIPFLQGNADFGDIYPSPRHYCSVANKLARANDILFSVRAPVGAINVADQIYGIGRGLCAITPIADNSQRYLLHGLEIIKCELFSVATGSTYEAVSVEQIGNAICLLPPPKEQQTIATFLDRETEKIDALIAEQQRLIELLKEKRQAVISHAVTKGLSTLLPSPCGGGVGGEGVPMKDSGIAWLGEVPEHWELKKLRFVAQLNPSKGETAGLDRDTEVSFLPMEAVGDDGSINLDRTRPIDEVETGYTYFREGDVTLAKITPCFENGKGAVMCGLLGGIGFGTTELIVVRPISSETTSSYLHWLFTSTHFRKQGEATMYGAGGQKRVPDDFVRNFAIGFPPIQEQSSITTFLNQETAKFDELTAEAKTAITLLQERRTALISAAVTGKIDVRGLVSFA